MTSGSEQELIIDTLPIGDMSNAVETDNSAHCVSAFRLTGLVLLSTRRESLYKSLLRGGIMRKCETSTSPTFESNHESAPMSASKARRVCAPSTVVAPISPSTVVRSMKALQLCFDTVHTNKACCDRQRKSALFYRTELVGPTRHRRDLSVFIIDE